MNRNLLFYIRPSNMEMVEVHLDYLNKYKNVFNGKKIFYVIIMPDNNKVLWKIKEIFQDAIIKEVEYDNINGISRYFNEMLEEVNKIPGITFFAHGIGMKVISQSQRVGLMKWVDEMYFNCLGNPENVDKLASDCAFVTTIKQGNKLPGSFYWFNNKKIFSKSNYNTNIKGQNIDIFPYTICNDDEIHSIKYTVGEDTNLLDINTWKNICADKLYLDNTTLIGIEGIVEKKSRRTGNAILHTLIEIDTKDKLFLSSNPEDCCFEKFGITVKQIDKLTYEGYSNFVLYLLLDYLQNDYMLSVQYDGWVVNSSAWLTINDQYDYIGAPWTIDNWVLPGVGFHRAYPWAKTGNGGVSFRSKKLFSKIRYLAANNIDWEQRTPYGDKYEDQVICLANRKLLESEGIKIANTYICNNFSSDGKPYPGSFAWHGKPRDNSWRPPNTIRYN